MQTDPPYETLAAEFKSAGGFWMRYADVQVLKTRDADAIDRMAGRKRRVMTGNQIGFVVLVLLEASYRIPRVMAGDVADGFAFGIWVLLAAAFCVGLQRQKHELADANERIRTHLEGSR